MNKHKKNNLIKIFILFIIYFVLLFLFLKTTNMEKYTTEELLSLISTIMNTPYQNKSDLIVVLLNLLGIFISSLFVYILSIEEYQKLKYSLTVRIKNKTWIIKKCFKIFIVISLYTIVKYIIIKSLTSQYINVNIIYLLKDINISLLIANLFQITFINYDNKKIVTILISLLIIQLVFISLSWYLILISNILLLIIMYIFFNTKSFSLCYRLK